VPLVPRPQDPDHTILHRALRVALVLPVLLWLGLHVLHDPQFALVAAFGSFAALGMADFTGPARSRLLAHLVLAVCGAALVVLGTALCNTLWPAVVAMFAIGVVAQFVMALGGQYALGNNAGVLAFVVAVMVPASDDAIASRVAGWLTAMACSALVATLLWPRHERRDLYGRIAEACRALGAIARTAAAGGDATAHVDAAHAALERVRGVQRALGFREIGPPEHQRALLGVVDALGQSWRFSQVLASARPTTESDRALALRIAGTNDAVAAVMDVCALGGSNDPMPAIDALVKSRHDHRALLDATAKHALEAHAAGSAVVEVFSGAFTIRVLSYITLAMGVDALVISGRSVALDDDFVVIEPTTAPSAWRRAMEVLMPQLSPRSVWFHNSVRAGLALALSVFVAKITDVGHAFWVVLATLSVLRSNVVTTGATVLSAVVGTLVGFVIATVAIVLLGPHPLLLWLTLPIAVFLAGYAPYAISFGAGQAMFALLVVELFNLMVPQGWEVGAARVEAVTLGALVALMASLIMWPKGASIALRDELAEHVRAAQRLIALAFDALSGKAAPAQVDAARAEVLDVRERADEAFAAFMGERGAKHVPLDFWGWLVRVPVVMRGAADAAIAMQRSGLKCIDEGDAARLFDDALRVVCASYVELAERLQAPQRAADPALRAAVADLDMIEGAGKQRAAILHAAEAYVDAHRDDAATVPHVMALALGVGWLGFLAHVRVDVEPALETVVTQAEVPWWR